MEDQYYSDSFTDEESSKQQINNDQSVPTTSESPSKNKKFKYESSSDDNDNSDSFQIKSDPLIKHPKYQFQTDKKWVNCQYHDIECHQIKRPNEIENEMEDPPSISNEDILNRIKGSMFGMALGDALGAHVEFRPRQYLLDKPVDDLQGGGTWGLDKGQFTDDTSMAICLANSLIACKEFNCYDQLVRYKWWYKYGYMSSTGKCFDIGSATRQSLVEFSNRQKLFSEKYNIPLNQLDYLSDNNLIQKFNVYCSFDGVAGNGALMRLAPVPLFFYKDPLRAVEYSGISGEITHGDQKAYDACRYYGALIVAALNGETKEQLLDNDFYLNHQNWFNNKPLHKDILNISQGSFKKQGGYDQGIRGKGYIVDALEAALWAFWSDEDSFEKGVLAAVNLGDDTDTTAAIYGQLAGAYYTYQNLPSRWIQQVYANKFIEILSKWIAYEAEKQQISAPIIPIKHPSQDEIDSEIKQDENTTENNSLKEQISTPIIPIKHVSQDEIDSKIKQDENTTENNSFKEQISNNKYEIPIISITEEIDDDQLTTSSSSIDATSFKNQDIISNNLVNGQSQDNQQIMPTTSSDNVTPLETKTITWDNLVNGQSQDDQQIMPTINSDNITPLETKTITWDNLVNGQSQDNQYEVPYTDLTNQREDNQQNISTTTSSFHVTSHDNHNIISNRQINDQPHDDYIPISFTYNDATPQNTYTTTIENSNVKSRENQYTTPTYPETPKLNTYEFSSVHSDRTTENELSHQFQSHKYEPTYYSNSNNYQSTPRSKTNEIKNTERIVHIERIIPVEKSSSQQSNSYRPSTNKHFSRNKILMAWTVDDVCQWIQSFGENYVKYTKSFRQDYTDGYRLYNFINNKVLLEFGVNNEDHRQTILEGIQQLRKTVLNQPRFYQYT